MAESPDFTSGEIASAAKEAATAGASPASASSTEPGKAAAPTREAPGSTESNTNDSDRFKGWIPPDAHERVVGGFHKRLDALAWASGLSREEVEDALAAKRANATAAREKERQGQKPGPDARDEKGEAFYSPQQAAALAEYLAGQEVERRMAELNERLGPIESERERSAATRELSDQIQEASAWPGFAEHIDAITAAINDANANRRRLTLHEAYIKIVPAKLAASQDALLADAKKKWIAELNSTTAATRTDEINPSRTPAASRKKDSEMSLGELISDEVAKRKAS